MKYKLYKTYLKKMAAGGSEGTLLFALVHQCSRDSRAHSQALRGVGILCFPFKKPLSTCGRLQVKERGEMFKKTSDFVTIISFPICFQ